MPTKPKTVAVAATGDMIFNAIRNNASQNFRAMTPAATADTKSAIAIGNIITANPVLQNEFINALVNRVALTLITSKLYKNPWNFFKKGFVELGETVEEVFVNICKVQEYDVTKSETDVFKRTVPDVRSAFHILNYRKKYPITIQNDELRLAFLSWGALESLIAKIVESAYTAANYDEFITMKYLLAKRILNGQMNVAAISPITTANIKDAVISIKNESNMLEFLSADNNLAGVYNATPKSEQYILLSSNFDATMDVEVLAAAFNMSKADFVGNRVLVDSFGKMDNARLAELFSDDPNYVAITDAEQTALDAIPAVIVDRDFFMIFDNLEQFTEQYNGSGLYWNYWLHTWKTFSSSPFANNVLFAAGTPSITSVTVSPATATLSAGAEMQLSVAVVSANFASKAVSWTSSDENVTVTPNGKVLVGTGAAETVTITATSVFDSTKKGTCTLTIDS